MRFLTRKSVANTLLTLLFLLIGLIVAEIVYGVIAPPPIQVAAGTYYTPKAKIYGWAFPPHAPLAAHDPDTGVVTDLFRTNAAGWKDLDRQTAKPPGTFRILVIGDSYTFGTVALDKLYTRQLEKTLKARGYEGVEVMSMGYPGFGVDHALVVFETEGASYAPDLVIYQNTENDLYPLLHGMREISTDQILTAKFLWPFYFTLDEDGALEKVDLSDHFDRAIRARRYERGVGRRLEDFLANRTLVYYGTRAWDKWRAAETVSESPPQQITDFESMIYGNVGKDGERHHFEVNEENLVKYRKNYKSQVEAMLQLTRKIESGGTDHRIMYVNPTEDPFVYRKGPLSAKDKAAWRLMEALLRRFKERVEAAGGKFLIFSEDGEDEGKKAYYRRVGNVRQTPAGDVALWADQWRAFDWGRGVRELRAIGERIGIAVVPRKRPYPRHLYDNHTNVAGNRNMALDIADFLETYAPFKTGVVSQ